MQASATQPYRPYPPMGPRKYRVSHQLMTRQQAMDIRSAHVEGKPVLALELQEAVRILSKKPEPKKMRLPELPRPVRERCNAVLLWNLGRALGRIEFQRIAMQSRAMDCV